jgi:hypothetical protein
MRYFFVVLFLIAFTSSALADTATSTTTATSTATAIVDPGQIDSIEQLFGVVGLLKKAYSSRRWMLLAALVLTVLVAGVRMFSLGQKLPAELVPWVTLGLAMLTSIALGLQAGKRWDTMLITGVSVGIAAIGGFETFGKLLRSTIRRLKG